MPQATSKAPQCQQNITCSTSASTLAKKRVVDHGIPQRFSLELSASKWQKTVPPLSLCVCCVWLISKIPHDDIYNPGVKPGDSRDKPDIIPGIRIKIPACSQKTCTLHSYLPRRGPREWAFLPWLVMLLHASPPFMCATLIIWPGCIHGYMCTITSAAPSKKSVLCVPLCSLLQAFWATFLIPMSKPNPKHVLYHRSNQVKLEWSHCMQTVQLEPTYCIINMLENGLLQDALVHIQYYRGMCGFNRQLGVDGGCFGPTCGGAPSLRGLGLFFGGGHFSKLVGWDFGSAPTAL